MTRWLASILPALLAACASAPLIDCACDDEKPTPWAQPLDEPELVHCDKIGQFLVCTPARERA